MKLSSNKAFGNTGILIPPIVFGTSYLGNLYRELTYEEKKKLVQGWFTCSDKPVVDSAGKYGAGLALEMIGKLLNDLGIAPGDVTISNKLGWYRVPLETKEPTFEPGVWEGCEYDAIQKISYDGIIQCWQQGEELLGGKYKTELVSVHDPDEYLESAKSEEERNQKLTDIKEAYKALFELKEKGLVKAVGIGSKDWHIIHELYHDIKFDWVMLANSFTIMKHTDDFLDFTNQLYTDKVGVINSAVFHGGFITGGDLYDYKRVDSQSKQGKEILSWRDSFYTICDKHGVKPSDVSIQFAVSHPAVSSLALNTSKPEKMPHNVEVIQSKAPTGFWDDMRDSGLISASYKYI